MDTEFAKKSSGTSYDREGPLLGRLKMPEKLKVEELVSPEPKQNPSERSGVAA